METVMKKLSEIEIAAKKIMENANAQLKMLDSKMQEQIKAFDEQVEADTQKRLEALREELQAENEQALKKLQDDTEHGLASLYQSFEEKHSKLSDEIVKRITEV